MLSINNLDKELLALIFEHYYRYDWNIWWLRLVCKTWDKVITDPDIYHTYLNTIEIPYQLNEIVPKSTDDCWEHKFDYIRSELKLFERSMSSNSSERLLYSSNRIINVKIYLLIGYFKPSSVKDFSFQYPDKEHYQLGYFRNCTEIAKMPDKEWYTMVIAVQSNSECLDLTELHSKFGPYPEIYFGDDSGNTILGPYSGYTNMVKMNQTELNNGWWSIENYCFNSDFNIRLTDFWCLQLIEKHSNYNTYLPTLGIPVIKNFKELEPYLLGF